MPKGFRNALAAAFCCMPALASGADFDGSKPLLCATVEVHDCFAGDVCQRGSAQSIGAPQFMRIDFAKKSIAGPNRTSPIVSLNKDERQLLLQGIELGYGWTIAINMQDGSMSGSLAADGNVVALFGACTPM